MGVLVQYWSPTGLHLIATCAQARSRCASGAAAVTRKGRNRLSSLGDSGGKEPP